MRRSGSPPRDFQPQHLLCNPDLTHARPVSENLIDWFFQSEQRKAVPRLRSSLNYLMDVKCCNATRQCLLIFFQALEQRGDKGSNFSVFEPGSERNGNYCTRIIRHSWHVFFTVLTEFAQNLIIHQCSCLYFTMRQGNQDALLVVSLERSLPLSPRTWVQYLGPTWRERAVSWWLSTDPHILIHIHT